jgi:hypothetical protein
MSKELPFFKFYPSEWLLGKIAFQPIDIQGAFTLSCCTYWQQECKMKESDIDFRIGKKRLEKLKELGFIKEENGFLHITFLEHQLTELDRVREKKKLAGAIGGKANAKQKIARAKQNVADKIEDKIKIREDKKDKFPPTVEEVIFYFRENGYTIVSAKKAFKYYNDANWIDSQGKKVLSWKQKMISVWFRDENKEPETLAQVNGFPSMTLDESNSLFGVK